MAINMTTAQADSNFVMIREFWGNVDLDDSGRFVESDKETMDERVIEVVLATLCHIRSLLQQKPPVFYFVSDNIVCKYAFVAQMLLHCAELDDRIRNSAREIILQTCDFGLETPKPLTDKEKMHLNQFAEQEVLRNWSSGVTKEEREIQINQTIVTLQRQINDCTYLDSITAHSHYQANDIYI